MGNVKEAEREESNALKIREQTGLSSDLSRSWYHLAVLYLREHRSQKAKEFAERAVDALLANSSAAPEDRIGSLFVLGAILCQSHAYPQAIAKIQSALEIANATYGSEKFPTGLGAFLLGYVDWKNGDSASADKLMRRGTEILSKELGWEHPAYLCVMAQYARFLRAERRHDLARAVEQQVKSMRAHLSSNPAYGRNSQINDVMALF
jgi:tetratricopeptide (TPR) repeat protein